MCKNHYLLQKNFQCLNIAVIKLKLDFLGIVWVCKHCSQGKMCQHVSTVSTPHLFPCFPFHNFP